MFLRQLKKVTTKLSVYEGRICSGRVSGYSAFHGGSQAKVLLQYLLVHVKLYDTI